MYPLEFIKLGRAQSNLGISHLEEHHHSYQLEIDSRGFYQLDVPSEGVLEDLEVRKG
jgi:hypothetical protein